MKLRKDRQCEFGLIIRQRVLVITGLLLNSFFSVNAQSTEFSENSFDVLRIENEIKLSVPNAIADSVWEYLLDRYDNDNLFLKGADPSFSAKAAEDFFIDQYYDNEQMTLLERQFGVRHRTRYVLSDTTDRKNGRQLLQVKINDIGDNELNRGEFKYKIKYYGGKPDNLLDGHPFFFNVDRIQREAVADRLNEYGINAFDLFPTIKIEQLRKRIYISFDYQPFATMTLDFVSASFNNNTERFTELELELNEINYTRADSVTKAQMEEVNDLIKNDLLTTFPSIQQDQTPKYNKAFAAMGLEDFYYRPFGGFTEDQISVGVLFVLIIGIGFHHWQKEKDNKINLEHPEQNSGQQAA